MQVTWRREDTGYLVAALFAVALIGYVVAGNLGLVPNPFTTPNAAAPEVDAIEPVLAAAATDAEPIEVEPVAPVVDPPAPPPDRAASDDAPPTVEITTETGMTFALVEPAVVEGIARDDASGVDEVEVTFSSTTGTVRTVPAELTCADAARRACVWQAEVPGVLAGYSVTAHATDVAGNGTATDAIDISVVNTGGPVDSVGGVVERAPTVIDGLARSLLGLLG